MKGTLLPLGSLPGIASLTSRLDVILERTYPDFFGAKVVHPVMSLKRRKVIHDNLWGTSQFTWRELVLIDSPLMQRLRDIHQVGLAFHVYPSAHHTRFEHSLGVMTIASKVYDALVRGNHGDLENIATNLDLGVKSTADTIARLKQELRLAALLHDIGHSLFSHTSELAYEKIGVLQSAILELKTIIGKAKGAGEVLSFCLANTNAIRNLLSVRPPECLIGETLAGDYDGEVDFANIALLIVGRASHPYLQFLGDIISSDFDADKLDYLLRDAQAAGLPLLYDLDRYLHAVRIERARTADGDGDLGRLYSLLKAPGVDRKPKDETTAFPYYESYRLRLPKQAINALEQIVICKMMLFSYLYHHKKVRAAEGMLERTLRRVVLKLTSQGKKDVDLIEWFLGMTDSALDGIYFGRSEDEKVRTYSYRILNRLLPRAVYSMCGSDASHAERALLTDFLTDLQDRAKRDLLIGQLEEEIGEQLRKIDSTLGSSWEDALHGAGAWVDVPKAPQFEGVDELVTDKVAGGNALPLTQIFPIRQWTQAYTHYRYYVRFFSFSEHVSKVEIAAKAAMQKVIGIKGDTFYNQIKQVRG